MLQELCGRDDILNQFCSAEFSAGREEKLETREKREKYGRQRKRQRAVGNIGGTSTVRHQRTGEALSRIAPATATSLSPAFEKNAAVLVERAPDHRFATVAVVGRARQGGRVGIRVQTNLTFLPAIQIVEPHDSVAVRLGAQLSFRDNECH